jgi:hypothetical protein
MTKEISPEHFDIVNNVNIYEMKTDGSGMALSKDFGLLSILFSSYQYNELEKKCYAFIMEKMQLLKDNPFEFYNIINDILLKLNAGKLSYKFKDKVKYISATVECLIKLDGEYIDEIVDVFLAGAEIVDTVDTIDTMPIIDF